MMAAPAAGSAAAAQDSPSYRAFEIGDISGGQETNPMWMSKVGNPEFRDALSGSFRAHGLASQLPGEAKYSVLANLQALDQPFIGASLTVTSTVQYIVTRKTDRERVMDETIVAPYTAAFSDSFYAVERLRLANEGSIRENISQFIQRVTQRFGASPKPDASKPTS